VLDMIRGTPEAAGKFQCEQLPCRQQAGRGV